MNDRQRQINDASRGDRRAVEHLLEAYLPRLRAFVRLRMGADLRAKESVSDLVQSACREVLGGIEEFEYRGESQFRNWLFTATLHKIQNRAAFYRAARRDVGREEKGAAAPVGEWDAIAAAYADVATPSQELMLRERIEQMERAFDGLSEAHKEVIVLARIVGLTHREIATTIGRSEGATRTLLYRALAELSVAMGIGKLQDP